jgi:hypothetical protein
MNQIWKVVLVVGIAGTAANAEGPCDSILSNGIIVQKAAAGTLQRSWAFASWFSSLDYKEAKKALQGTAGIAVEGVPFSAGMSQDEYSASTQRVKKQLNLSASESFTYSSFETLADPAIVAAWQACTTNRGGASITVRRHSCADATLELTWRPTTTALIGVVDDFSAPEGFALTGIRKKEKLGPYSTKTIAVTLSTGASATGLISVTINGVVSTIYIPKALLTNRVLARHATCEMTSPSASGEFTSECFEKIWLGRNNQSNPRDATRTQTVRMPDSLRKEGWSFLNDGDHRATFEVTASGPEQQNCGGGIVGLVTESAVAYRVSVTGTDKYTTICRINDPVVYRVKTELVPTCE